MNEKTRTEAVDASAQFAEEMITNLERAAEHPDITPELVALLSTSQVEVEYRIESGVKVDDWTRGREPFFFRGPLSIDYGNLPSERR